jgi:cell division protein FtsL
MNQKVKKKSNSIRVWLFVLLLFVGELYFYTWCRVQHVKIGYLIVKETQRKEQLHALRKNLKIELALLKSPKRIAKIAQEKLGLQMPDPKQIVDIK